MPMQQPRQPHDPAQKLIAPAARGAAALIMPWEDSTLLSARRVHIEYDDFARWIARQPQDRSFAMQDARRNPFAAYLSEACGEAWEVAGTMAARVGPDNGGSGHETQGSEDIFYLPAWAQGTVRALTSLGILVAPAGRVAALAQIVRYQERHPEHGPGQADGEYVA